MVHYLVVVSYTFKNSFCIYYMLLYVATEKLRKYLSVQSTAHLVGANMQIPANGTVSSDSGPSKRSHCFG